MSRLTVQLDSQSPHYQVAEERLTGRLGVPTQSKRGDDDHVQMFAWHGATASDLGHVATIMDSDQADAFMTIMLDQEAK